MTTYEARQERPCYLDRAKGAVPRTCAGRKMLTSYDAVGKTFDTFTEAERYARRILGQRSGVPVEIFRRSDSAFPDRVAIVSRDPLDRTWTDILVMDSAL